MSAGRIQGNRELVLNVDDNEPARYAKGRVLTEHGYRVIEAANGTDALAMAATERPDVIVLDVGIPGIDGIEVCRRLKAAPSTAGIPVVQVSASFTSDGDRVRALEGGADTYLTEPMEPRVLVATVSSMVRLRRAEAALRASEARFRTMADAAPVMIWVADVTGRCTWLNRRWLDFIGGSVEGDPDVGRWETVHAEDRERCRQLFDEALARRGELRVEYRVRDAAGAYRWVLDHSVPWYDGDTFQGLIGSCIDITDRRSTEEERKELLELERRARSESDRLNHVKDEFLATLSHELRTPLNAILGWAQVIRSGKPSESEIMQAIERIERNAHSQARIIEDLLDMSRIISGKVRLSTRPVQLSSIVAAAVDAVGPAATARPVEIVVDDASGSCVVEADADRVQQILWNLLSNAIKFSPPNGRVTLTSRLDGDFVECDVVDEGIGIDPQFLPHVFERFRQADPSSTRRQGGLGLGLAIVKNLTELHGGSIAAFSRGPGQGARFRLRLPLSRGAAAATEWSRSPRRDLSDTDFTAAAVPAGRTLLGSRILIVDDHLDARDLLQQILEGSGAQVDVASSAREGLDHFVRARPDLVISDIGMPGLDGYSLIRRIRELEAPGATPVPAMALTAFARHEDREQALRAGFQRHLVKPILAGPLLEATAQMLGRGRR